MFDGFAGADPNYALRVRILAKKHGKLICSYVYGSELNDLDNFEPDFTIINASDLKNVDYKKFGMNSETFIIFHVVKRRSRLLVELSTVER